MGLKIGGVWGFGRCGSVLGYLLRNRLLVFAMQIFAESMVVLGGVGVGLGLWGRLGLGRSHSVGLSRA